MHVVHTLREYMHAKREVHYSSVYGTKVKSKSIQKAKISQNFK